MIQLNEHSKGVVLPIRAQPGARRNAILGEHNGALKVAVTAPPDQGKANQAILELLAKQLGCKKSQVELLSGQTSRDKKILIRDVPLDEVGKRLSAFK